MCVRARWPGCGLGWCSTQGEPLSAPPALSDPGWPQLSPMEQRGFEIQAGVWDVGPSPNRHIPLRGQRARGRGVAANPYQRGFPMEAGPPLRWGAGASTLHHEPPFRLLWGHFLLQHFPPGPQLRPFHGAQCPLPSHPIPSLPTQLPFPFLAPLVQTTPSPSS